MLKDIEQSVQQTAEAIAIAVGVEVEIVDNTLTIIGGSGYYRNKLGGKEEAGRVDGEYLYARVLRSGNTEVVTDTATSKDYGTTIADGKAYELAEVCTPIIIDGQILGIIGLIAANEKQKAILLGAKDQMVTFVEKMAELLASKALQNKVLSQTEEAKNELNTVLETAHEGIFSIDMNGYIKHCNTQAAQLLNTTQSDIVGSHISKFMPGTPALDVLRGGVNYTENDEQYNTHEGRYHFVVTTKTYGSSEKLMGAVISFRDIAEVQKLVYNINNRALKCTFEEILGESAKIKATINQALRTARGNSTVLITGESGTGKEMFAKAIHYSGNRSKRPFVTVNCGAIPENLLESELFGYEKGAFTGANDKGKIGKFEIANGGTIFLDEIGDMPLHLQVKLLHVLQNMRFERVGGNKIVIVDVRIIAATNRKLEEMIKLGSFREDLYYRLSVIPLDIPPLRERREDIKMLMEAFIKKYNNFMGKTINGFTTEAEKIYYEYEWPGNVRELENAIEYGINMSFSEKIDIDAIPLRLLNVNSKKENIIETDLSMLSLVRNFEKEVIVSKMRKYNEQANAKEKIAEELGMSRATFYRRLAEFELL